VPQQVRARVAAQLQRRLAVGKVDGRRARNVALRFDKLLRAARGRGREQSGGEGGQPFEARQRCLARGAAARKRRRRARARAPLTWQTTRASARSVASAQCSA
jgi:hypothetical protein